MPVLLERDRERARIEHLLSRGRDGVGGVLIVRGPAGIGKSSLLAEARVSASQTGMRVLRARGAEFEREFGFGVVRQLFEPVLAAASPNERAEWLDGVAGGAARQLGLPGAAAPTAIDPLADASFAVLHGLYWLLAQLSSSRPLCLLLDDVQWADTASLRYLAFLLPRLDELPLVVLAAARSGEEGPGDALLTALAADPVTEVVEPAPLSQRAVGLLLAETLGRVPDDTLVARCARATGGTPFLVEQLATQMRDAGVISLSSGDVEVPTGPVVARWVLNRLIRLGNHAERLARAASILEPGGLPLVAELAGLPPSGATTAWSTLINAGILRSDPLLVFVHPLVRRAVYDGIGRAEQLAGHHRAARLLAATGAADELVAEHLLVTTPAADPWVVDRLMSAAAAATGAGAPDSATTFLLRASQEPPGAEQRSDVLLTLGLAAFNADHPDSVTYLRNGAEAAEGTARVAATLMYAYAMAAGHHAGLAGSGELLLDAIAALATDNEATRRSLDTFSSAILTLNADLAVGNQVRIRAARRRANAVDATREVLALAAQIAVQSNEPAHVASELAHRALHTPAHQLTGPVGRMLRSATTLQIIGTLLWSEDPAASSVIDAAIRDAHQIGDAQLAACLGHRAWLALARGDLRSAEQDARSALEAQAMPAPGFHRVMITALAVEALTAQDRITEAERLLDLESEAVEGAMAPDACLRLSRGRLRLARQQPAEALADFLGAGHVATRLGLDSPSWLPWRSNAALALLVLGERDEARDLAARELELARILGTPRALGVALHIAGLTTDGIPGESLLREAIDQLGEAAAALDQARAQCDLGARLRRGNRRVDSRDVLRAALGTATHLGAPRLARRAETEARDAGARPRRLLLSGPGSLTASERRVADLAVDGLTNRQIAQALFVTDRTVEGHLTSTFRKLGIGGRDKLASALHP